MMKTGINSGYRQNFGYSQVEFMNRYRTDRTFRIECEAETSEGEFTVEELTARYDEQDRMVMQTQINMQKGYNGEGIRLGGDFSEPEDRSRFYRRNPDEVVTVNAIDINGAIKVQPGVNGGDLKNIAYYAAYLRDETAAATGANPKSGFFGTWGKDHSTNNVDEYIGWLFQAVQAKSRLAGDMKEGGQ
jgi:hypothetical protein